MESNSWHVADPTREESCNQCGGAPVIKDQGFNGLCQLCIDWFRSQVPVSFGLFK